MDKRYKSISASEQLDLRREASESVPAHPEWPLPQAIRHIEANDATDDSGDGQALRCLTPDPSRH